jgi:hypothetical protein
MALPISVTYTFATATSAIPLSQLDANFTTVVNGINGIGNGTNSLSNVVITGGTIDGTTIGATTSSTGRFSTVTATTGNITTINATTTNSATVRADGNLTFQSNGTTTAMTIDTSQNVGIGTASPSAKLDVSGNVAILGSGGSSTNRLSLTYNGGTGEATVGPNSTGGSTFLTLGTSNSGTYAERARIDASGNLLVGRTSAAGGEILSVQGSVNSYISRFFNTNASPFGPYINYPNAAPNGASNQFLAMADSGANRAYFNSNGGLANYQANNINLSDERKKTDIQMAGSYLDKICAIPVKTFLYKDQTDTERNLGVIAQDVEAVAPELVDQDGWLDTPSEGEEPYKSIYQTDLQYALMKCIQELKAENDALKARVAALETK